MKEKLFTAFIILLGVLTAFAFYAFWHTEPQSNVPNKNDTSPSAINTSKKHEGIVDDVVHTEVLPSEKKEINVKNIKIEETIQEMESIDLSYDNQEEKQADTQDIYEALLPDDYEETIEQANETFDALDEHVRKVDEMLKSHMELSSEESTAMENESTLEVDEEYEMELPIIE